MPTKTCSTKPPVSTPPSEIVVRGSRSDKCYLFTMQAFRVNGYTFAPEVAVSAVTTFSVGGCNYNIEPGDTLTVQATAPPLCTIQLVLCKQSGSVCAVNHDVGRSVDVVIVDTPPRVTWGFAERIADRLSRCAEIAY